MDTWIQIVACVNSTILGYVALTNIQHGKQLAVLQKVVDGLVTKMDLFLKTEIDTLKELAKKS